MTQQDALSAALSAPPPPPPPSSAAGSSNSGSSGGGSSRRGSGAAAAATTTTTGPGSVKDYIKIINEISNRNGLGEGEGGGSGVVAGGGGGATAGTVRRGLSKRNVNVPTTAPSGVAPAASSVAAAKAKLALSTTNTTGSCSSTESESSSSLSAAATSGGGGGGSGTGGTGRMANKLRMSLNDISNRGGGHPNLPSTPSKKGGSAASAADRSTGAAGARSTPSTPSSVERARKTSERIRKLYGSTAERTGPTNSTPSKSAVAATAPSPPTGAGGGPDLNRSFEMPPRKKKNDLLSPLTLRRRNSSTPRDHEELDGLVQDAGRMHRRSASGGALDGVPRQQRPPEWGEVEVGGESPNKPAKDRLRDQIDRSRRLQSALKDVQTAHRHELRQLQSLPDSAADGPPPTSAAAQSSSAGKYSGQIRQRLRKTVGAASQVKQLKRAVKGGGGGAGGGGRKTSPEPRDIVVSKCESAVVVSAESQLLQQRHRREIMARSQSMSSVVGTARTTTPTTTTTRSATSSRIAPPGASPDEDGDLPSLAAGDLPPLSSRHRRHSSEPPPPPPDAAPPTPPSTGKGAAAAPGRPIKARATTVTVTQQSSSSTATHVSLLRQGQGREEYAAMTSEARLTRQIRATHRGEHPGHRINARTYNTVKVHVYDLIHSETWVDTPWGCEFPLGKCFSTCNDTLHFMGTGAYHAGIEVNGVEYAYGSSDVRGVSGVFTCFPKASPGYEYRTTLDFGKLKTVNRRWMRVPVSPDGGGGGAGGSAFRSAMDGGGRSSDDGVMSDVGVGGWDRSNPYPRTPAAQRPPSSSSVVTPEEREEGGEYGGGKITYASEYREVETFLDGLDIMRKMSMEYMGVDYDLFRKNCCTFVKDACIRLGVKEEEIPTWFLNLADAGVSTEETLVAVDANVCAPIKNMIEVQADEQERIANEPFEASSSSRLSQEPKKCNTETLFTPEGFEVIAEEIEGNYGRRTEMEIVRVEESQEHAFDIHGGGGASSRKTAGEQEDSLLIGLRETLSWTY